MKTAPVKLILVISLSLLLLVTFYNETYADIKKSTTPLVKPPLKQLPFRPDIKQYAWVAGQPLVTMIPVNEGLCALTGVAGNFRGGGEQVAVSHYGGNWVLGGGTKQDYLWAQAHCIKYKDFGKDYANIRYAGHSGWLGCNALLCNRQEEIARYDRPCRAGFLQGISGDYERPSAGWPPELKAGYVTWKSGDYTYGYMGISAIGRGIRKEHGGVNFATNRGIIGCLSGNVPNMSDRDIQIEYKIEKFIYPQNQDKWGVGSTERSFCTIAGVSGFFHGGGERVNLAIDSKGTWVIQGQTMQQETGIRVWCFEYR
jgi:hypothetical protein